MVHIYHLFALRTKHNPYYEGRQLSVAQTEEMRNNEAMAKAREAMQKQETEPSFSIALQKEKEVPIFGGRTRMMKVFEPIIKKYDNE